MGQARLRTKQREAAQRDIKIAPRKRVAGYALVHHNRIENQGEDGMIYARNVFAVVNPDTGESFVEETPDGPKPVLLMSVPQPVRRSVFAALAR